MKNNRFENPSPSRSQDRDHEVSGLHDIIVNWLHTRVGKPIVYTLVRLRAQIRKCTHRHAHTHADTETSKE